jgi:hypothetical protein
MRPSKTQGVAAKPKATEMERAAPETQSADMDPAAADMKAVKSAAADMKSSPAEPVKSASSAMKSPTAATVTSSGKSRGRYRKRQPHCRREQQCAKSKFTLRHDHLPGVTF